MNVDSQSIPKRLAMGYTLQASKWQKCPLLVDVSEMASLLGSLGDFWIAPVSGIIKHGDELIDPNQFLEVYSDYIETLKKGEIPNDNRLRTFFSSIWTADLNALYSIPVNETSLLIKVEKPVVQLQMHRFDYSAVDEKFRSMVLGENAVLWGIQFSFPQLYQDAACQVFTVRDEDQFPNAILFRKLQQWTRAHTLPTPFEVGEKRINVPIRLGKKCFEWINYHPQLQAKGLKVIV